MKARQHEAKRPPPAQRSRTRSVGYYFAMYDDRVPDFDEQAVEDFLEAQKAAGVVTTYYCKKRVVWCNGPPGAGMRRTRDEVSRITGLPSRSREWHQQQYRRYIKDYRQKNKIK